MKENQDRPGKVSTCFEEPSSAEMIEKLGEEGLGTLYEEMMRPTQELKIAEDRRINPRTGGNKMIESLMKLHKCAHCPIRCQASRRPRSLFARIHRWHATWWPGWRLYQAELGLRNAKAAPQA